MPRNNIKSFTLVELLIVIAILAVLAAAVVIVLNPAELLAQARDSQRVSDLSTMKSAVDIFIVDNPTASLGTAQKVYISLPDANTNCSGITGLPTLPTGWTYNCVTSANLRNTNGTGWIPLNFGNIYGGSPIPYLPIDPVNDLASGRYYTYVMGGSYELTALMEANKENASVNDGGSLPGVYQVGTHIDLTPPLRDKGLVGLWAFEGIGSIVNGQTTGLTDSSGSGNNGTAYNPNGTGMAFATGKVGNAVQIDGPDDTIRAPHTATLATPTANNKLTWGCWFMGTGSWSSSHEMLINKQDGIRYLSIYNGQLISSLNINGTQRTLYANFFPTIGTWYFTQMTWDGTYMKFYVDGVLASTSSSFAGQALDFGTGDFQVGAYGSSLYFSGGMIDDIRVYNRALSAAEIKAIYNATK